MNIFLGFGLFQALKNLFLMEHYKNWSNIRHLLKFLSWSIFCSIHECLFYCFISEDRFFECSFIFGWGHQAFLLAVSVPVLVLVPDLGFLCLKCFLTILGYCFLCSLFRRLLNKDMDLQLFSGVEWALRCALNTSVTLTKPLTFLSTLFH